MRFVPCLALGLWLQSPLTTAHNEKTRTMYTIRPPKINRERRAVEIIDLGTFLLTNSEDGRPKKMVPFYLNIFETRKDLSEDALKHVEDATSEFLLTELNTVFKWDSVETVSTRIVGQERFVKQIDEGRKLMDETNDGTLRGRQLRQVPGSKLEVNVNVTFDREPSPDVSDVDDSLQFIMKDLVFLVDNITASEDPELGYVFMAYREEISKSSENPTVVSDVQIPAEPKSDERSMKSIIIPILVGFVFLGAVVALFVIRRRRRRVQAANQKAQEDLAFLDEETNVFSFENSPTKSSARKRAYGIDTDYDGDNSSCSRYSTSQGSLSHNSPSYNMVSGMGSPTARSSLSGASTVKVSNARLMPLPSKLTELASTSLFAFSEEDEDFETSTEGGNSQRSQRTTPSVQPSVASNDTSAFNRIMNGKSDDEEEEEGIVSIASSPRHGAASPTESTSMMESSSAGQQGPSSKSTFASFFSSNFFSSVGGDSVSQFNHSTLTVQAANTTEAVKKKAAKQNVRSFSLSPRHQQKSDNPTSPRAKSDTGGDDESADSVFDFLQSPKTRAPEDTRSSTNSGNKAPQEQELSEVPLTPILVESPANSAGQIATKGSTPAGSSAGTPTATMTTTAATTPTTSSASASPGQNGATDHDEGSELEALVASVAATPATTKKSNNTSQEAATSATASTKVGSASRLAVDSSEPRSTNAALEALRNLKKVVMTPQTPVQPQTPSYKLKSRPQTQAPMEDNMSEEDSLSEADAPGSFPRRNRRHAKSTTHDGTFAYQTNAMQPQEWSMTDGYSDDDTHTTLSEQGGGAFVGAFPKAGFRSPPPKRLPPGESPSNQSRSSYSQVTQTSPGSKAESSQASASRQLINDLVWLSKKIAGVKQSAVESAPGETSALGAPPQIEPVDSLSYASQDGLISPSSVPGATGPKQKATPGARTPTGGASVNTSIVCRDCYAPPGKLNIVIHSTKDGPAVHEVKSGSCLEGRIYPGDLIIAVDDTDTRAFTAAQLMKMMAERSQSERKITVLHFEEADTIGPPSSMKEA